jgi:uncharacterized protein (TIGR02145 family)
MNFRKSYIYIVLIFSAGIILDGCDKPEEEQRIPETGSVTDVDGNIYKTVKIGDQWWMQENLKVTRYSDSSYLANGQNENDWKNTVAGAYCVYASSAPGLLYNYSAVSNEKKLAPAGWHIPTDEEWKKLEQYLGMSPSETSKLGWRGSDEGDKMKIASPAVWKPYEEIWSDNASGFTALAGGCRLYNSEWSVPNDLGSSAFFWSSSSFNTEESYYRYLDYKNANIFRSHAPVNYGFSVRCVKD